MTNFACHLKVAGIFNMKDSTFNPDQQQQDISSKIVAGLERISEVFKVSLYTSPFERSK